MHRLGAMFLGLLVVLLVALALLLGSALESVEMERELRHRALAERIFDEMERELTTFLRGEEDRPFEHYRTYYASGPAGSQAAELLRSALADPPRLPFVVGYFQMGPDGAVTTPQEDGEASSRIEAMLEGLEGMEETSGNFRAQENKMMQAPGTTEPLEAPARERESGSPGYFDELGALNRGADARERRTSKTVQSAAVNVHPLSQARETAEDAGVAGASPRAVTPAVEVVLESIVGRRAGERHLLLHREALSNGARYRQGFLVEIEALVSWLEGRVLSETELSSRVGVAVAREDEPLQESGSFRYRHQFAEPFAEVAAIATLLPLPQAAGAGYIYLLSMLAGLAATAGLFGLYRTVSMKVSFAERRQNFVSAVSHELKTPLTAIRMYGEMLRDGLVPSSEKRQQYYEVITAESERLTRLVNNVLELSRLERKSRDLHVVAGSLKAILEEVVEVLGPHARREGFLLRVDCEPGIPDVLYDRDALLQVLFNLVDNAIKYSKGSEKAEIRLQARRSMDGVALEVIDCGPGVGAEHLKRVFEPFYRAESELTRTSQGTGIGLALVRGLVESMGGTVAGENVAGGGFKVSIHFPAVRPA